MNDKAIELPPLPRSTPTTPFTYYLDVVLVPRSTTAYNLDPFSMDTFTVDIRVRVSLNRNLAEANRASIPDQSRAEATHPPAPAPAPAPADALHPRIYHASATPKAIELLRAFSAPYEYEFYGIDPDPTERDDIETTETFENETDNDKYYNVASHLIENFNILSLLGWPSMAVTFSQQTAHWHFTKLDRDLRQTLLIRPYVDGAGFVTHLSRKIDIKVSMSAKNQICWADEQEDSYCQWPGHVVAIEKAKYILVGTSTIGNELEGIETAMLVKHIRRKNPNVRILLVTVVAVMNQLTAGSHLAKVLGDDENFSIFALGICTEPFEPDFANESSTGVPSSTVLGYLLPSSKLPSNAH
jgi:hypothetical protein